MVVRALLAPVVTAALVAVAAPAAAAATTTVALPAVEDVGFPFGCSWGYDWEERCWRDDSDRLPIGGADGNAWRTALRFSLASIPADATVAGARLALYYDRACIARRASTQRCDGRSFTIDVHSLADPDWFHEREPAFHPSVDARFVLPAWSEARWMTWDLTVTVEDWYCGIADNNGLLLTLTDEQEAVGGGPKPPSSSFAAASLRPRLVVTYER